MVLLSTSMNELSGVDWYHRSQECHIQGLMLGDKVRASVFAVASDIMKISIFSTL
jgi:hypothetical protein